MSENPVIVLGAGATKECGGPLTFEILPEAFTRLGIEEDSLKVLGDFLKEQFYLPAGERREEDYPALPLLLSLVDTAIDRKQSFGRAWPVDRVRQVRDSIEYAIFTVLRKTLGRLPANMDFHYRLFRFLPATRQPTVISMNYDIIVDNAFARLGAERSGRSGVTHMPDYGTEVTLSRPKTTKPFGTLLKIHGSLHWLHCPTCARLRINLARTRDYFVKGIWNRNVPCQNCGTHLETVMITPTHLKDYRNPHISRVWYEAEQALRKADRVIIIGYSLPSDDVEVAYLLKRGLDDLPKQNVTVVEFESRDGDKRENPKWQRYHTLFGTEFEWRQDGFKGWLDECTQRRRNPFRRRLDGTTLR